MSRSLPGAEPDPRIKHPNSIILSQARVDVWAAAPPKLQVTELLWPWVSTLTVKWEPGRGVWRADVRSSASGGGHYWPQIPRRQHSPGREEHG